MEITTNNVPRDVIEAHELTLKERIEFDYIDWNKVEKGEENASFFRYKGELHDLGEFMSASNIVGLQNWDGYRSDAFYFGLVVKYVEDFERVIVGRYCT